MEYGLKGRGFKASILFVAMIVCTLSATAKEVTIGKLKYKVNTTDKIAKCTGLAEEATKNYNLEIPSTVEYGGVKLKVTTVEKGAFRWDNHLRKVTLSDYTETIGANAFSECDYMSVVSLGNKLKEIGTEAFAHCGNGGTFTSVTLPATVETINDHAFTDCRYLTIVSIGKKIKTIGDHAFWNCQALKSITLPGSLQSVGESAFACCDSLNEVTFENGDSNTVIGAKCFDNVKSLTILNFYGPGVVEIGESAFIGCSIQWLALPSSVRNIGVGAFCGNNLTLLDLPEGLKTIGNFAFCDQYGSGIRALTIPSTVTSIGLKAFNNIGDLEAVNCNATTPPALGENAFDKKTLENTFLMVPPASVDKYVAASGWKEFLHINNVETSVKEIEAVGTGEKYTEEWFDMAGNRLASSPSAPGIYIIRRGGQIEKRMVK